MMVIMMLFSLVKGGKILARFDCPAHKFLFPESDPGEDNLRRLKLEYSRRYYVRKEAGIEGVALWESVVWWKWLRSGEKMEGHGGKIG